MQATVKFPSLLEVEFCVLVASGSMDNFNVSIGAYAPPSAGSAASATGFLSCGISLHVARPRGRQEGPTFILRCSILRLCRHVQVGGTALLEVWWNFNPSG